ncbi:MAG TPA: ATP-binding protein [Candidatus Sulfomarinibacteraceae bacterium]|nr:ATP-binding protein [Candidatus Sulfomarinibacteraceae bacterium]
MANSSRLSADRLYHHTDPKTLNFETTEELNGMVPVVGQDRALDAVRFGTGIQQQGYNLFALGPHGLGKYDAINQFIEQRAGNMPIPPDWCYVHNFEQSHKPRALELPAGRGVQLRDDMVKLVDELQAVLPAAFDSEEYHAQRQAIEEEFKERQEQGFEELKDKAQERNIALVQTPSGLAFAPMRDGEVINPKDFLSLPEEEQKRVQSEIEDLQEQLQRILRQVPQWQKETRDHVKELKKEVATFTVSPLFEELREKYSDLPKVLDYLEDVQKHVIENVDNFLQSASDDENPLAAMMRGQRAPSQPPSFTEYEVNLLVDNSDREGAPIVHIELPTYHNLIGRVEHMSQMGALLTNFTLIKPGAFHEANGGYLLLDARKLLQQPYAWEGMKRCLRTREIAIESLGQMYSMISTVSLEPEPIPLDIKVVLLGERILYYLLYQYDPEFGELFKVMVDFDDRVERSEQSNETYAQFIASMVRRNELRHFDRAAVARIIEHSARLASDQERLSTHMQSISDLLREANYWAGESGNGVVHEEDVQKAIDEQIYRASRLRERMQEAILRDTVLIDTSGEQVGQINGLSVLTLSSYAFGRPSRITARVQMGKGEVIDIERRVELGGPIHSKGVFILSGFLGSRYAAERPLSLSASIVFEQSYAGVDGDSASSAELYALLSALAEAPIKQAFAVTGSVNQHGEVQAIGGVNEKVEGFFDICQERGLTGEQGVLIPDANVKNLMLRQDVRDAVADGKFHIYPVENIDQGIELLTGIPAGEPDEDGNYPEGTINYRIVQRLDAMAEKLRKFSAPPQLADSEEDEDQPRSRGRDDEEGEE